MTFSRNGNDSHRRLPLSAASYGQPISISTTTTNIHTTLTSNQIYDEVWLYASNTGSTNVVLTVTWAGTSSMVMTIPASSGLTLVSPGLLIAGTGSATSSVSAVKDTGTAYVFGYVIRTTI